VQTSRFATIGPVPVALLGLAGFTLLLGLALARLRSTAPELDVALVALALGAALYVTYLTYVEIFVLGAVCPWCVAVALSALTTFVAAAIDVALPAEGPRDPRTRQKGPSGQGPGSLSDGPDGTASVLRYPASLVPTEARRNDANARERTTK
jgi:hypothetical protein